MTNIGTTGCNDLIRQAIGAGRNKTKTQSSEDAAPGSPEYSAFNTAMLGHRVVNINATENQMAGSADRWTEERLYTLDSNTPEGYRVNRSALNMVKEKLESEGIDADSRTPTHEITDEQMEWLGSRYDLDFLSVCSFTHAEYGNFMLDLAYMNVFSLDEVENMYGVMPFNSNHKGYLYKMDTGDGLTGYVNPFGRSEEYIAEDDLYTRLIMEYIKAKYAGHTDEEYGRMTEDFKAKRAERMMIIENFFARAAERSADSKIGGTNSIKPNIEDASGKIKEDFGKDLL